jgi:hypothetical protein
MLPLLLTNTLPLTSKDRFINRVLLLNMPALISMNPVINRLLLPNIVPVITKIPFINKVLIPNSLPSDNKLHLLHNLHLTIIVTVIATSMAAVLIRLPVLPSSRTMFLP